MKISSIFFSIAQFTFATVLVPKDLLTKSARLTAQAPYYARIILAFDKKLPDCDVILPKDLSIEQKKDYQALVDKINATKSESSTLCPGKAAEKSLTHYFAQVAKLLPNINSRSKTLLRYFQNFLEKNVLEDYLLNPQGFMGLLTQILTEIPTTINEKITANANVQPEIVILATISKVFDQMIKHYNDIQNDVQIKKEFPNKSCPPAFYRLIQMTVAVERVTGMKVQDIKFI